MTSPSFAAEVDYITGLLAAHYPVRARSLHLLTRADEKRVWRVEVLSGEPLIVRAYARPDAAAVVRAQATLLAALAAGRFPAERLVPTRDGSPSVSADGWTLLVTTALDGRPIAYRVADLRALGARLGQLHTLGPDALGVAESLGAAAMLPAREIAWVSGELTRVVAQLGADQRARHDWFCAALAALDRCDDLPVALIHNDCHPGNAIIMDNGEVALIDWEGAGLGPALVDLGFLLSSCDTPLAPSPPDLGRVAAAVAGYRQFRQPTRQELARLPDAIRFRALIFGAADFAARPGAQGSQAWWRTRYDAADELARRARALFGVQ